jgi:hypothetical protein
VNKLLGILKWIAIYYGFKTMIGFITFRWVTLDNFDTFYDTNGVIAVLLTLACFRIERTEMVRNAPSKKSKFKYFLLILVTLGIVLFIYKKRKEVFL